MRDLFNFIPIVMLTISAGMDTITEVAFADQVGDGVGAGVGESVDT